MVTGAIRQLRRLVGKFPKGDNTDRVWLALWFREKQGRWPDIETGGMMDLIYGLMTSGEADNQLRARVCDKEKVKEFVREHVGDDHNVPTIAVLRSMDEVRSFDFPDDCVIKPTHLSGYVEFRRSGSPVPFEKIKWWFSQNYYNWTRERCYQYLVPKVIVEPFIFGLQGVEDFKFFCVRGEPRVVKVFSDRFGSARRNSFNMDWKEIGFRDVVPGRPEVPKPKNLHQMRHIARQLSQPFNFIRVDMYSDGENALVGELTNFPGGLAHGFLSREEDRVFSNALFGETKIKELYGK